MHPLYSSLDFDLARSRQLLPLKCACCEKTFYRAKNRIKASLKAPQKNLLCYCSQKCNGASRITEKQVFNCTYCDTAFARRDGELTSRKNKGLKNHFCCQRCAGLYNSQHRTTGTRRAKLEVWLENELRHIYPTLNIHFNRSDAINAELDIYIPSLRLAFELNGVFHYEPIFGAEKLSKTQNKDRYKLHACTDAGIDLCVIDTSGTKYFKPKSSQHFLDIIVKIIEDRNGTLTPSSTGTSR